MPRDVFGEGMARPKKFPGIRARLAQPSPLATPAIAQTDQLIAANQAFRNRSPGVNLTQQAMAPPAPGGFANVKVGGGLRLRGLQPPQAAPAPPQQAAPAGFSDALNIANAGQAAAKGIEARSKFGTAAIPLDQQRMDRTADGQEFMVPGLRGNRQMQQPMDMEKRNAYLANRAQVMAGRREGVIANAMDRSQARKQRIADRQRVPTPLEQMAARNPQLAAQLAAIQGQRDIAGINAGARTGVAGIEAGWRGSAQQGQQRATDVAADVAILTSPDASPQAKQAAAARISMARGGGVPQDGGATLAELPQEQKKSLDQAPLSEAEEAMRNMGVSQASIERYKRQRQKDYESSEARKTMAVNLGSFVNPGLMAGNAAARIQNFVSPQKTVGLNPDVVKRLTTEQRRRIGIP